jgi:hypothetical protein
MNVEISPFKELACSSLPAGAATMFAKERQAAGA